VSAITSFVIGWAQEENGARLSSNFWSAEMASAMKSLSRLIASGGPGKKQKTETTLEEVAIEDGFELKQFTFEEGAIGFEMSGMLEHTSFGIDVAIVKVSEVVPDSQAAKFGVTVGSIVKMIGKSDVTQVKTMEEVLKMLRATPRPVEITMTVPLPNEELDGERARSGDGSLSAALAGGEGHVASREDVVQDAELHIGVQRERRDEHHRHAPDQET
jgi:hypothetical protein